MDYSELTSQIFKKESFLCIGLDSDINKIPSFLLEHEDPIFEFNKQIIDSTHDLAVAYKPNTAFYESNGSKGWLSLEKTVAHIKNNYPDIFLIADAKRGDIGNTSHEYAKAFFQTMNFDAITVAPYMGSDSVKPFLSFKDKWVIILALTSNEGSNDFQLNTLSENNEFLFEKVISTARFWGDEKNTMFVVGATKSDYLKEIRKIAPNHFLLIPGVGAQGGSLTEVAKNGINNNCGLLVNSSREIIYSSQNRDFAIKARIKSREIKEEMKLILKQLL
ncbi:MAG: orotidine-5'-phosphate decarboxylase [Bacteroidales bacterium]|nr:orotidine-5'-phosphate decarboxylase [Bacteroidales bacterium]MBN2758786.1 orotidine-5'-phosphate decarboxylase [Bacteroidales bacterium]